LAIARRGGEKGGTGFVLASCFVAGMSAAAARACANSQLQVQPAGFV